MRMRRPTDRDARGSTSRACTFAVIGDKGVRGKPEGGLGKQLVGGKMTLGLLLNFADSRRIGPKRKF